MLMHYSFQNTEKKNVSLLGSAPGQSVEEEGSVEGIQERQQPQGLPARGGQLAPLQLVQQVSLKYCAHARTRSPFAHRCEVSPD